LPPCQRGECRTKQDYLILSKASVRAVPVLGANPNILIYFKRRDSVRILEENPCKDSKFPLILNEKIAQYRIQNPNMVYGWERHLIPLI
jgi:hypothetical protein